MNHSLLGGLFAAILLASCASNVTQTVDATEKAYIVLSVDNQTKRGFMNPDPMGVTAYFSRAFVDSPKNEWATQTKRDPILSVEVIPGTYKLAGIVVTKDALFGKTEGVSFRLDTSFHTYFTVRPGEVAYLGSYLLTGDGDPSLEVSLDMASVQDAMIKKNPLFEGYRWFSIADDRPSFF